MVPFPQNIVDRIKGRRESIDRHQLVTEPIRNLGDYLIPVSLTLDLVPEIRVVIHREGEVFKPAVVEEEIVEVEETKKLQLKKLRLVLIFGIKRYACCNNSRLIFC